MMDRNIQFKGTIRKIIPKLSLLPILIWGTANCLTLKAPITNAADDILLYCFSETIRLDVSSESSARIHMKNQALFSLKDKSIKLKCRLLQFLFGALRDNFRIGMVIIYVYSTTKNLSQ